MTKQNTVCYLFNPTIIMNKLCLFAFLLFIIACQDDNYHFPPIENHKNLKIDSLDFEKIELDVKDYECSYYGYSYISGNQINFVDKYLCQLFTFSADGQILSRNLGSGKGPKEVACTQISAISKLSNGELLILGYSLDHYFFSENLERTDAFWLSNNENTNKFEKSDTYTTFYPNLDIKNFGNYLYYNVYSESDHFNFIDTPQKYYENGKNLMQVNRKNGKIEKLLGNYPPFYRQNIGLYNAFPSLNYDLDSQGNLYLAYEADSTIYKYSAAFNPIKAFGYQGKDMNTHYKRIENWNECSTLMQQERSDEGFYTSLFYSPADHIIFRSYQKGIPSNTDGLLVYQNDTLIGNLSAPKHIKIGGYIAPYYYSTIITDAENDNMYVYRFRLPQYSIH